MDMKFRVKKQHFLSIFGLRSGGGGHMPPVPPPSSSVSGYKHNLFAIELLSLSYCHNKINNCYFQTITSPINMAKYKVPIKSSIVNSINKLHTW